MGKVLNHQLEILKDFNKSYEKDGSIIFHKQGDTAKDFEIKVVFFDYIINPFNGFDFHKRFNKDNPPPIATMFGKIEKESEKMYFLDVHSEDMSKHWRGWCPKKSCTITKLENK